MKGCNHFQAMKHLLQLPSLSPRDPFPAQCGQNHVDNPNLIYGASYNMDTGSLLQYHHRAGVPPLTHPLLLISDPPHWQTMPQQFSYKNVSNH